MMKENQISKFSILIFFLSIYHTTDGALTSSSVTESGCILAPPAMTIFQINVTWFAEIRNYYMQAGSKFGFYRYAEVLLNRSADSTEELGQMCLRFPLMGATLFGDVIGFGQRFTQQCVPIPNIFNIFSGQFTCIPFIPSGGSPGTNPKALLNELDTIVWTDNQNYVLLVRCVDGLYKDYQLISVKPLSQLPDSAQVLQNVKTYVAAQGFDMNNFMVLPCNCISY